MAAKNNDLCFLIVVVAQLLTPDPVDRQ